MISDLQELSGTIRYIQRWVDTLEAMRMQAAESEPDRTLLPTLSSGPLAEIRHKLVDVSDFVHELQSADPSNYAAPFTVDKAA